MIVAMVGYPLSDDECLDKTAHKESEYVCTTSYREVDVHSVAACDLLAMEPYGYDCLFPVITQRVCHNGVVCAFAGCCFR